MADLLACDHLAELDTFLVSYWPSFTTFGHINHLQWCSVVYAIGS